VLQRLLEIKWFLAVLPSGQRGCSQIRMEGSCANILANGLPAASAMWTRRTLTRTWTPIFSNRTQVADARV
jgi:hypothetical protein